MREFLTACLTIMVSFYLSRLSVKRAHRLVEEVGKAATRLESSFESRRATIRNLAVLRSIEDQAHEVSLNKINMFTSRPTSFVNFTRLQVTCFG